MTSAYTDPPMTTARLAPVGRRADRRGRWTVAASLMVHGAVLLVMLGLARSPQQNAPAEPSYDLVFESGGNAPPANQERMSASDEAQPKPAPDSAPEAPPPSGMSGLIGPESPAPESLPDPNSTTTTSPQTPASSLPQKAVSAAAEPSPASVPLIPEAPPPADLPKSSEAQPPRTGPQVRLQEPPAETPRPPVPEFKIPAPPIPLPLPPSAPPPPKTVPNPSTAGTFANPLDLDFGNSRQRLAAPRSKARAGSVASRSIDLSLGEPKDDLNRRQLHFAGRAKSAVAAWNESLYQYWLRHRYFPPQALSRGQDGTVELELTVNRNGRVEGITITRGSGSEYLDMASIGSFRNAKLPPLPDEIDGQTLKVPITIDYMVIGR